MRIDSIIETEPQAAKLITRYNLDSTIEKVRDTILRQSGGSVPVTRIHLSDDPDWDNEKPRVLVTVEFETDLVHAYEAWKEIRPFVTPLSRPAELGQTLAFTFAGRD